jgi:hypothetical protein
MRALNRHLTRKWKKKRKHRFGDKCKNPKCFICHSDKVLDIPNIHLLRENEKLKQENYDI